MTSPGAATKPDPSSARLQDSARPRILSTDGSTLATTSDPARTGSGGATSCMGVVPNGPRMSGNPVVPSMAVNAAGIFCSCSGATSSILANTEDPRTALPGPGPSWAAIGTATSHATSSTAAAWNTAPTVLSRSLAPVPEM